MLQDQVQLSCKPDWSAGTDYAGVICEQNTEQHARLQKGIANGYPLPGLATRPAVTKAKERDNSDVWLPVNGDVLLPDPNHAPPSDPMMHSSMYLESSLSELSGHHFAPPTLKEQKKTIKNNCKTLVKSPPLQSGKATTTQQSKPLMSSDSVRGHELHRKQSISQRCGSQFKKIKQNGFLYDFFINWAGKSTVHGLSEFASSRTLWIRLMWGVVLVAAMIVMAFQIFRLSKKFGENDTATRVTTVPIDFHPPSIVYCTDEVFNETKINNHNISKYLLMEILSVFFGTYQTNMSNKTLANIVNSQEDLIRFLQEINMNVFDDVLEYLMQDPHAIFSRSGAYTGIHKIGTPGGPCYQIDLKRRTKKSYQIERYIVSIRQRRIPPIITEIRQATYSISNYYHVQFGEQRVPLVINAQSDALVVATRWKRISKPTYPCKNDNENPVRDVVYCETRCEDDAMRDCFGCIFYFNTSRVPNEYFCKIYMYEQMRRNRWRSVCYQKYKKRIDDCLLECAERKPCDEWNFEISALPRQTRLFRFTNETLRYLTIVVKYPYSSAFYEEYFTYTLEQFMSDLGGQMGLFFGASVLSILQLLYFLFCMPIEKRNGVVFEGSRKSHSRNGSSC